MSEKSGSRDSPNLLVEAMKRVFSEEVMAQYSSSDEIGKRSSQNDISNDSGGKNELECNTL